MRVLYIATSFPEPGKGATIYTDLAEALHEAGHEITVAVSEQAKNKQYTEMKKERGFDVLRIVTGNYYDVGFIEKGITTLKIPMLMKKGIDKYLGSRKFDFILFESPPVTNAGLVAWAKKKFSCPSYLMLKDIFPQNAVDLGIIKGNSILHRYFKSKEKKLLQTADHIGAMSTANKQYVLNHNSWIKSEKMEIFPNTKKLTNSINSEGFPIRERFGIPEESCVFLFGGNMGRPQYVDLLCEVIKECKNEKDIYFLFIGRGTDRYKLELAIKEYCINNAIVIENLPRSEYEQITKECDVGLIVLDPRFTIPNYPSRILAYMEYAKPVIAATDKVTDLKEMIEKANCGEWVWSGDVHSFIKKIKEMAKSERLTQMGANGRKYLENNFNVNRSVEILEKHFEKVR
ncbi:glycosyltransferase family 4 protein [Neobacillus sp. WH10]|uniref:glycosyltransferase family 4 protein n=1 Tax=Neobacillus sp. WH10 TaxID=3047873 RepID=UPI0024C0F62D|nr:glycosyltransferase family 4 protein [Neobacillus sp. WH10]WHY77382.1 glycosyltransferase family 4 protein [Neobacillus sp. WH10]